MTRRLIGFGAPDRGDDIAGWSVADAVTSWPTEQFSSGSFELVSSWDDTDDVVIVDAMRSGAEPGTIRRFDAIAKPLPIGTFRSSHAFGPAAIVELARSLGQLPRTLRVYGIEIGTVEHGAAVSPDVTAAIDVVVRELDDA
ncbi:MAG: hydrogenase maturation protease [Actinomycetia bacterium]|nr:hydrogenase maturation protease [Actinomycetes bacterium]